MRKRNIYIVKERKEIYEKGSAATYKDDKQK